jgi:hypothetical protein
LECFGRQNNTKELQLWKRQNQSTQSISLINPSSSSSSSSFPQISKNKIKVDSRVSFLRRRRRIGEKQV